MKKDKGQALIEGVIAINTLTLLGAAIIMAAGLTFTQIWAQHWIYQALLCQAQGYSHRSCRHFFLKKTKGSLPFIKKINVRLKESPYSYFGHYQMIVGGVSLQGHRSLRK